MVITTCPNCSNFVPRRRGVSGTSLSQNLSCGHTYFFTVTAVTRLQELSAPFQAFVRLKPAPIDPVLNLKVEYFPGNLSTGGSIEAFDRFLLTWDPPKKLPNRIEVQ